jgi:hypothetical protein
MKKDHRKRDYYLQVEEGKAKNDYTNSFLNHFGFCDYHKSASVSRDERKYRTAGGIKMAGNSTEWK